MKASKVLSENAASENAWSRFDLPSIEEPENNSGDLSINAPIRRANFFEFIVRVLISPGRWARLWRRLYGARASRDFYYREEREAFVAERASRIAAMNFNGVKF